MMNFVVFLLSGLFLEGTVLCVVPFKIEDTEE